ncbi:MAG: hypothetical protein AAFS10_03705 [Myxococcota bacterium]
MPSTPSPRSIPNIVDIHTIRSEAASEDAAPDLLIEVPHGATATADFEALAAQLVSPLPGDLVDFFHVNTDVGAFELAIATAQHLTTQRPYRTVVIVRCRIPRTFIDCNRRIGAKPEAFAEGRVTPGLMPWITAPHDHHLLRQRYEAYIATVRGTTARLRPGAGVLLLHTYAPYSVAVEAVDANIAANMRRAYQPDTVETWPRRPELDVISRDIEGRDHAPTAVVDALRTGVAPLGWTVGDSVTYPMHPSTMAWDHVIARPGLTLCLEVRRDLLADPFDPFAEMHIGTDKLDRLAAPLAAAIADWGYSGGTS